MSVADQTITAFAAALAARAPTPGGGASAAVAAALGCATGAMAARYTTGPKFADRAIEADGIAERLDQWRDECLRLADADAAAFAAVGDARKSNDPARLQHAELNARQVPLDLLHQCANAAALVAEFAPRCNPFLISDIHVAIRLLAGAGRAAWATALVNQPTADDRAAAARDLNHLDEAERVC
jgi:formiminotetrahydrofolate cyclodeaminase